MDTEHSLSLAQRPLASEPLSTPLLFLVFNRPDTTRRVFERIRLARPKHLYVAADGPRREKQGEDERVTEVRHIISAVDWPCTVKTLFRDENLGCKRAVSEALAWFFEHEPEGIILEDDCVPHPQFFAYCSELLDRFRNDERIGFISGTSLFDLHQQGLLLGQEDFVFSRYLSVWGWASWRRVWREYDPEIACWSQHQRAISELTSNLRLRKSHQALFDKMQRGLIDTWDYQVTLMLWVTGRLAISPRFNLIENIGFNDAGTHTTSSNSVMARLSRMSEETLTFPLISPPLMIRNRFYEKKLEDLATRSFFSKVLERVLSYVR